MTHITGLPTDMSGSATAATNTSSKAHLYKKQSLIEQGGQSGKQYIIDTSRRSLNASEPGVGAVFQGLLVAGKARPSKTSLEQSENEH
jgi:hypothetical protein